jgi:hypothetical protein
MVLLSGRPARAKENSNCGAQFQHLQAQETLSPSARLEFASFSVKKQAV